MLRIQLEGFTIELGRDRSAPTTAVLSAALPFVMQWLHRCGFGRFVSDDDKPRSSDAAEPN